MKQCHDVVLKAMRARQNLNYLRLNPRLPDSELSLRAQEMSSDFNEYKLCAIKITLN